MNTLYIGVGGKRAGEPIKCYSAALIFDQPIATCMKFVLTATVKFINLPSSFMSPIQYIYSGHYQ